MDRYVIPRNKRRHLVVSQEVHDAVRAYAACGEVSLVEATYRLLKLGLWASHNVEISDEIMEQHRIKRPRAFDPRRWFRRSSKQRGPQHNMTVVSLPHGCHQPVEKINR